MELVKHVTQADMDRYSGPGNIHSDAAVAAVAGLDAPVAQGMMTMAYASELLTMVHGDAWLSGGELAVKFTGLVYAGDTVTVSVSGDGGVEARNQDGTVVMVGEARLRSATEGAGAIGGVPPDQAPRSLE